MLARPRRQLEVLSISALDLFASALGVFVLVAILMFPYYLREPSVDQALDGARAELAAAGHSLDQAEMVADGDARRLADLETAVAEARQRLNDAQASAARAEAEEAGQAEADARAVRERQGTPDRRKAALTITDLDLVFVMDTTGSMAAELADLRASLLGIIRVLHRLAPTLRVGFVAYKDRGDAYVTRAFPLQAMNDAGAQQVIRFVDQLAATGGGDEPEPVDEALAAATAMAWRSDAQGRIVVIGDAPAHAAKWQRTLDLARDFSASAREERWPRRVSSIFTGSPGAAQAFFERLAASGDGDFTRNQGQMIESVLIAVLRAPGAVR